MIAAYTAGAGFLSFIFVILVMSKTNVLPNLFVPISFFYFAALFGICFLILRQGGSTTRSSPDLQNRPPTDAGPAYLRPVTTSQLPPSSATPASVTEQTTRTLDEVARN